MSRPSCLDGVVEKIRGWPPKGPGVGGRRPASRLARSARGAAATTACCCSHSGHVPQRTASAALVPRPSSAARGLHRLEARRGGQHDPPAGPRRRGERSPLRFPDDASGYQPATRPSPRRRSSGSWLPFPGWQFAAKTNKPITACGVRVGDRCGCVTIDGVLPRPARGSTSQAGAGRRRRLHGVFRREAHVPAARRTRRPATGGRGGRTVAGGLRRVRCATCRAVFRRRGARYPRPGPASSGHG